MGINTGPHERCNLHAIAAHLLQRVGDHARSGDHRHLLLRHRRGSCRKGPKNNGKEASGRHRQLAPPPPLYRRHLSSPG
jgi:hypothetical protein